MAKKLRWQPLDIDLHAFMEFVRSRGAASLKEIKDEFHTDSGSVRKVAGFLWHHQKVWVLGHGRGVYIAENTHKKGSVSVPNLRRKAGVVAKKSGRPKKGAGKGPVLSDLEKLLIRRGDTSHREGELGEGP